MNILSTYKDLSEEALKYVETLSSQGIHIPNSELDDLDNFLQIFVHLPRNLTVFEIFHRFEDNFDLPNGFENFLYDFDYNYSNIARIFPHAYLFAIALYPLWVDKEGIKSRRDNFAFSVEFHDKNEPNWKEEYRQGMLHLMLHSSKVYPGNYAASFLGGNRNWDVANFDKSTSVSQASKIGIFNLRELYWAEFKDTFDEEGNNEIHSGIMVETIDENFIPRLFLWEGSISEAIARLRSEAI